MTAKQKSMPVGVCIHDATEDIFTQGGALLGQRCQQCTKILGGYGDCDGCGARKLLTVRVDRTDERFCTNDCKQAVYKDRRAQAAAKSKLGALK